MNALVRAWYRPRAGWVRLLLPLAWLFAAVVWLRRWAYRNGWFDSGHPGAPVIVVGNITVGGTGKTPLVAAIVEQLVARGRQPGIVARGYGGSAGAAPILVTAESDAQAVGDEPLLLAKRTGRPVVVCGDRLAAARHAVSVCGVDVVVSDDGLQHYALARDAEIAVRDVRRGYGNGCVLPVGPLREPVARLQAVDIEFTQGAGGDYVLRGDTVASVSGAAASRKLAVFAGMTVHAVAAIGDPERFFATLREAGVTLQTRAFADHHAYSPEELAFTDGRPVLMTEKDAVKCAAFAEPDWWYLPVTAHLTPAAQRQLDALYNRVLENL